MESLWRVLCPLRIWSLVRESAPGESLVRIPSLVREFRPWRVPGEGSVPGERVPSLESPW